MLNSAKRILGFIDRGDIDLRSQWMPSGSGSLVGRHDYYDVFLNPRTNCSDGALLRITRDRTIKNYERNGKPVVRDMDISDKSMFRRDPLIPQSPLAELYKGSGYDEGHMAPARYFQFDQQALKDTFLTSNICPQTPELNRGPWRVLEDLIFDEATQSDECYVVLCGPIYDSRRLPVTIGDGSIRIPDAFWKLVIDPASRKAVAYEMQNTHNPTSELDDCIRSIECIESKTGLLFATGLIDTPDLLSKPNDRAIDSSFSFDFLQVEDLNNGEYILLRTFSYDSPREGMIVVPRGFVMDFGSIPKIFHNLLSPIGTKMDKAYVIHDWVYGTEYFSWSTVCKNPTASKYENRSRCDWLLLEAGEKLGVSWCVRNTVWTAVRSCGWAVWSNHHNDMINANRALYRSEKINLETHNK